MALQRYTLPVDGTIPVQALLYTDEQLYASQEGVGIYDGLQKSPPHQSGTIYTTSHRLFYIDVKDPENISFSLDLAHVSRTEYYAGLFTSSPKVTLHLFGKAGSRSSASLAAPGTFANDTGERWECEVCGCKNWISAGHSPSSTQVCELCGVPRPSASTHSSSSPLSSTEPLSKSLPPTPRSSSPTTPDTLACPACTFLNHSSLRECEVCGTQLPAPASSSSSSRFAAKSAPATRPVSPDTDDDDGGGSADGKKMMRVSFRKGGDKPFYAVLKRSLQGKAWEVLRCFSFNHLACNDASIHLAGILRNVETSAQGRDTDLKNALQDLEALMIKARDMVKLAGELNEKLTSATSTTAVDSNSNSGTTTPTSSTTHELPEEATFIRSSLAQLGLQMTDVPVTNDMIKDEDKWVNELAKELAGVLKGMMKDRGIIALDEVWGGWNRARGVALLPPTTLLLVLPHLPNYTSPQIHKRTFVKSGLSVLHAPRYTPQAFSDRLVSYLMSEGPKTTMEVAILEEITVALTKEMIDDAEMRGDVVRDDMESYFVGDSEVREGGGDGLVGVGVGEAAVKWWPNVFAGYLWDGEAFDD
ncbi:hypothetical protein AGABI2DRAFT_209196 [Agaricus bisporus var. bisporus H97]|uniref:hypothetical protein n=1 Tax=Agaricus bisporus var. bisporus (strain H97 / ATCC MYA-4626 / FGSC 10389) TaxID=936046 RepID=UPI00029F77D3|nr:hypothetical protein AGABI2DRAFT_209196 [Agaricus bisporus var. bisporus H97]EKV44825.1 hypothetical protein AGABI2DRAFT_209196 [Agaricus bisporus var. bisporus H97]